MAVQFPNFLSVTNRKPDYSGIANMYEDYYAGKAMPKEDLIRAIQAEFARPQAEQGLIAAKLSNKRNEVEINRMAQEAAQQAAFEKQLRQAFGGNPMPEGRSDRASLPLPPVRNAAPIGASTTQTSRAAAIPGVNIVSEDASADAGFDPAAMDPRFRKFDKMASGLPASAYTGNKPVAAAPKSDEPEFNEIVVNKGDPHLIGVDKMWDENPLSRAFLQKKGFKKKTEVKFDNKTGRTTLMTEYPSGKVTTQTYGGGSAAGDGGIPLTNAMITKHQNVIAGVDNVIPVLENILKLGGGEKLDEKGNPAGKNKDVFQPYPRSSGYTPGMGWVPGWMSDAADYESMVTSAAEPLVNALGYPKTNEGIEKAVQQVVTTHGETNSRYIKRIRKLIEELKKKKEYSEKEVKRSSKISPVNASEPNTSGSGETYSSDEWEVV